MLRSPKNTALFKPSLLSLTSQRNLAALVEAAYDEFQKFFNFTAFQKLVELYSSTFIR